MTEVDIVQVTKRISACRRCRKTVVHAKTRSGRDITLHFPLVILDGQRDLFDGTILERVDMRASPLHDDICAKLKKNQKTKKTA